MALGTQKIQGSHDGHTWEDIGPDDSIEHYLSYPYRRLVDVEAATEREGDKA